MPVTRGPVSVEPSRNRECKTMAENITPGAGLRPTSWRLLLWGGAAALLSVPLIAMQFTSEVNWTGFDFAFMAALMGSVGLGIQFAVRRTTNLFYRAGVFAALSAAFLLIVVNGAVGIIGDEGEIANLLYLTVVALAIAGAAIARFQPVGMARTMTAAGIAQVAVPLIALGFVPTTRAAVLSPEVPIATLVFCGVWLVSAALFRQAARQTAR